MNEDALIKTARVLAHKGECGCTGEPTTDAEFIPCGWCQDAAREAIRAYESAMDAAGTKRVPVEATEAMQIAALTAPLRSGPLWRVVWDAMLAAAPGIDDA